MTAAPEIPAELRALMVECGLVWGTAVSKHVKLMIDGFTELQKKAPKDGVRVERNIAYGPHPRQAFDVYTPEEPSDTPRPALLFVHGGAFVEGNRNRTDEIYSNILYYVARHGVIGINIGYRIAPDALYPDASRDIAAVVKRVREQAADFGIDPNRIFLMGHSAGAAHVGTYAYDKRHQPAEGPGIAGLIIVSGRVRADNLDENPNARKVETYYQTTDPKLLDDYSPVSHVGPDSVPTLVAWAEFENPLLDIYCSELVYRLAQAKRRGPPVVWLKGHNHSTTIAHINTADDLLGRAMLAFIADPR